MADPREERRGRIVWCAKCHLEIYPGEGRYCEPDGQSYHPICYDQLKPELPMTVVLTRGLAERLRAQAIEQGRTLEQVVGDIVASRRDIDRPPPSLIVLLEDDPRS